ncbi:DNA polymerase III subunit alpha [Pseudooceanicola batsensis HTCC2597]|uniref:DNA polymerase III subunit alpha n=1 Tax=Pseudooceanicola batsensis (strain ATCC BAA-863 / DSM 15984 / KCTC 12145 / HTCC2597) TaxID=252305 RepID=A3TUY5_PSEBH|nr:DNA polymerase III subunit alpha [Pseudooceanicola batsensis HTCC2597]
MLGLCACQGAVGPFGRVADEEIDTSQGAVELVAGTEGQDRVTETEAAIAAGAAVEAEALPRPRLFAFLKELAGPKDVTGGEPMRLAALPEAQEPLPDEEEARPVVVETEEGRGLFGFLQRAVAAGAKTPPPPAGPESDIVQGTVMAFGNIGRICDLPRPALGKTVDVYPADEERYRLHDPDPESTRARTFHITGFEDGCARQFTGAMAMFGEVGMHESIRYGAPGRIGSESDVDKAYDRVKRAVCRVGRKKPCGDRIETLRQDTVFLSVYETFGMGGRWSNILIHDGRLVAATVASNSAQ